MTPVSNIATRRRSWIVLVCFFLGGCASWAGHGVTAYPHQKIRIDVLPVQSEIEIKKLTDIEAVPQQEKEIPGEQERIRQQIQTVRDDMARSVETRLNASPYFEVVLHEQVSAMLKAQGAAPPLTAEQIKSLGAALQVKAVLVIRLAGYGHLKKKWVIYLISTGVVEGVTEGAVAGGATGNIWVGLAVALEEIGQEVLTWGGGAYLFNMYYAPVTLEGELISSADGKQVWSHTTFDSIDRKMLKKLPEGEQKKKEMQLRVTAEEAEKNLVENLERTAKKHLWKGSSNSTK